MKESKNPLLKNVRLSPFAHESPIENVEKGTKKVTEVTDAVTFRDTKTGLAFRVHKGNEKEPITIDFLGTGAAGEDIFEAQNRANFNQFLGGVPTCYEQAAAVLELVKKEYPGKEIVVTGHSLGGGLANYATSKAVDKKLAELFKNENEFTDLLKKADINKDASKYASWCLFYTNMKNAGQPDPWKAFTQKILSDDKLSKALVDQLNIKCYGFNTSPLGYGLLRNVSPAAQKLVKEQSVITNASVKGDWLSNPSSWGLPMSIKFNKNVIAPFLYGLNQLFESIGMPRKNLGVNVEVPNYFETNAPGATHGNYRNNMMIHKCEMDAIKALKDAKYDEPTISTFSNLLKKAVNEKGTNSVIANMENMTKSIQEAKNNENDKERRLTEIQSLIENASQQAAGGFTTLQNKLEARDSILQTMAALSGVNDDVDTKKAIEGIIDLVIAESGNGYLSNKSAKSIQKYVQLIITNTAENDKKQISDKIISYIKDFNKPSGTQIIKASDVLLSISDKLKQDIIEVALAKRMPEIEKKVKDATPEIMGKKRKEMEEEMRKKIPAEAVGLAAHQAMDAKGISVDETYRNIIVGHILKELENPGKIFGPTLNPLPLEQVKEKLENVKKGDQVVFEKEEQLCLNRALNKGTFKLLSPSWINDLHPSIDGKIIQILNSIQTPEGMLQRIKDKYDEAKKEIVQSKENEIKNTLTDEKIKEASKQQLETLKQGFIEEAKKEIMQELIQETTLTFLERREISEVTHKFPIIHQGNQGQWFTNTDND